MSYFKYNVNLTKNQKDKILKSYQKHAPITIRLKKNQLTGNDALLLTKRQVDKIIKSKTNHTGTDIKFSTTQMRQQKGGSFLSAFLSALLPAITKVGSMALPYVTKMAGPLLSGTLSGLSNIGIQFFFKGSGLFSVPQDKVEKLIKYKDYLTQTQKKQIINALQSGSGFNLRLTKRQQEGGFLGTLLASLAIPMIMKAITGKGRGKALQVDPSSSRSTMNIYVPPKGGYLNKRMLQLPPFYGQWPHGSGIIKKALKEKAPRKKALKKKGKGLILGQNSPFKNIPLLGDIF